jgi:hypothetical protein
MHMSERWETCSYSMVVYAKDDAPVGEEAIDKARVVVPMCRLTRKYTKDGHECNCCLDYNPLQYVLDK